MARKRDLSPKEKALWKAVAKTAKPNKSREALPKAVPLGPRAELIEQPKAPRVQYPADLATGPRKPQSLQPASLDNLDGKTAMRLQRGRLQIDGKLDLHGLTRDRALEKLRSYIPMARQRGWRMVLVITGTGRGRSYNGMPLPVADAPWERSAPERFQMPTSSGVLRRDVPLWLESAEFRPHVVAVTQAQPKHGGAGALYVYLRRDREG